jgi:hypothetical protein
MYVRLMFWSQWRIAYNKLISCTKLTELRKLSKFLFELICNWINEQLKSGARFRGVEGQGIVGTNTLCIELFRKS